MLIVLVEEAVDRGLQVHDGAKDAALEPALCYVRVAKKPSTALSQEADVSVECPSRVAFEPSSNIGMLVGGGVVDDGVDRPSHGNLFLDDIEEANELLMTMALLRPITVPSSTFMAANSVVAPCRS